MDRMSVGKTYICTEVWCQVSRIRTVALSNLGVLPEAVRDRKRSSAQEKIIHCRTVGTYLFVRVFRMLMRSLTVRPNLSAEPRDKSGALRISHSVTNDGRYLLR